MSNTLSIAPPGPEASGSDGRSSQQRQPGYRRAPAPQSEPEQVVSPEQRLIIQEVGDTGTFVYTVIDRTSGQVMAQASREEVAKMSERKDYAAGSLIKTRA